MFYRLQCWIYRKGFRPKPNSLFYHPGLAFLHGMKDRVDKIFPKKGR